MDEWNQAQAAPESKVMQTYESFKSANDEALAASARGRADVLLEEKVERIGHALDHLAAGMRRPALGAPELPRAFEMIEHKAAFNAYLRTGQADGLRAVEAKALNGALGPDAGYLVPPDAEAAILARMAALSPIRGIATVRPLANSSLKKAVSPSGSNAGWATETTPASSVSSGAYAEITFPTMEVFAQPAATQTMLDDAAVDVESWIGEEIELAFAEQESAAFVTGDGTNKPKGFLTYPTIADTSWSWGNLGTVATGVSADFPAANPSDVLVDLVYALKSVYRQNAVFVMNRATQSVIRKFKDSTGNYLWSPPTTAGARASILNFPVIEAEAMAAIGANSLSVAFGDFRRGYLVVDRVGIRALRDPFSAKPYVLFYTTKRVGGGVQDFQAIKLLRFGT